MKKPATKRTPSAPAEWVHVSKLVPWDKNPRKNDHRVPEAVASLRRFGFAAPIVAWRKARRIVAGHTRLKAVLAILEEEPTFTFRSAPGPGMVPVRWMNFASEAEANAYALRDNNSIGEWDEDALADVLRELGTEDVEIKGLGWSDKEIAKMLGEEVGDGGKPVEIKTSYAVLIEVDEEPEQLRLIEEFLGRGLKCRALI